MSKVTVGLITYNRPILLKRALYSLINQSYKDIKIYIGNDYPKEKITFKKLNIKMDPRIKIFNHKKNLGERGNLHFLLKKTKTEWFTWLADDDYFHKDFIKILYYQIKKNKNSKIVASYSNYSRKDLKLKLIPNKYLPYTTNNFLNGFSKKKIRLIGTFGLMRTKILKKVGGIHVTGRSFTINGKETHHYPYCDTLIPILLSLFGDIIWLDQRLVYLNTDKNSVSSFTKEYKSYLSAEVYLINKLNYVIKKKNLKDGKQIVDNFKKWFFFNRLTVIEKRNPFSNLFSLSNYLNDLKSLYGNNLYNIKNGYFKIFKSIMISFKNLIQ